MDATETTIAAVVALITGGFALVRYIISENRKMQTAFLEHLQSKNGHTERIANKFDATVQDFRRALDCNTSALNALKARMK